MALHVCVSIHVYVWKQTIAVTKQSYLHDPLTLPNTCFTLYTAVCGWIKGAACGHIATPLTWQYTHCSCDRREYIAESKVYTWQLNVE